jgi:hypothetical protein
MGSVTLIAGKERSRDKTIQEKPKLQSNAYAFFLSCSCISRVRWEEGTYIFLL